MNDLCSLICLGNRPTYVFALLCSLSSIHVVYVLWYLLVMTHACAAWQLSLLTALAQPQFSKFKICCYYTSNNHWLASICPRLFMLNRCLF